MGAALLDRPEVAADIITTLRRNIPPHLALSAKVRLLPGDTSRSLEFCRRLAACGVDAVTVHCRTATELATSTPARWGELTGLVQGLSPVPVVLNGDLWGREEVWSPRGAPPLYSSINSLLWTGGRREELLGVRGCYDRERRSEGYQGGLPAWEGEGGAIVGNSFSGLAWEHG